MPHAGERFADRLARRIDSTGSPVCVGLDPVIEQMPAEVRAAHHEPVAQIEAFTRGVIDAVSGIVPAVKFQSACYERFGAAGVGALERGIRHAAAADMAVVLDAKRGDIGLTASHYAAAARHAGAHAITVNAYLGPDTVKPYIDAGLGVFVLVRTSNPDSDAVQEHTLADGQTVAQMLARHVAMLGAGVLSERGISGVGAVVGATKPGAAAALRELMPAQVFLVPGYGAQGGTAADVRDMLRANRSGPADAGVLVTSSRAIIYAKAESGQSWQAAVAAAAKRMAGEIAEVVRD